MRLPPLLGYCMRRLRSVVGQGLLVCGAGFVAPTICQAQTNSSLCWQENVRLKQRDFTAEPEAGQGALVAATHAEVKVWAVTTAEQQVVFIVTVRFIRNKSWFDQGQTVGNWTSVVRNPERLLAHEQLHFDIAELIARRIRKLHATYQAQKSSQSPSALLRSELQLALLKEEIKCLLLDRRALDDLYDAETNHGLLPQPQQEWQQRVQHELETLKAFRSKESDCL